MEAYLTILQIEAHLTILQIKAHIFIYIYIYISPYNDARIAIESACVRTYIGGLGGVATTSKFHLPKDSMQASKKETKLLTRTPTLTLFNAVSGRKARDQALRRRPRPRGLLCTQGVALDSTDDDYGTCCLFCPGVDCGTGTYGADYDPTITTGKKTPKTTVCRPPAARVVIPTGVRASLPPRTTGVFQGLFHKCCGGHCSSVRCPSAAPGK